MIVRDGVGLIDAAIGGGGGVRPFELAARAQLAAGRLKPVLRDRTSPRQPIHAVFPASRNVPAKVGVFLDFIESLLG